MTKEKVKVLSLGPMGDNMLVNGKVANNMESVPISVIKEIVNKVFGKMVKKSNGWIMKMNNDRISINSLQFLNISK
jgi:hypothetical protein